MVRGVAPARRQRRVVCKRRPARDLHEEAAAMLSLPTSNVSIAPAAEDHDAVYQLARQGRSHALRLLACGVARARSWGLFPRHLVVFHGA
jgi:hypothetical protein